VIHRHLEVRRGAPAEELPSVALVDILERGDLADWQPIAAAIARDPCGKLADRVIHLVNAHPMYGTSPLWRSWIDRCRARAEAGGRQTREIGLAALRRELGLTQVEVANRAGMSQSDLSKLERRRDVRLSTLRSCVAALGGRLRLLFESDDEEMEIRVPDGVRADDSE
jgi:DNA-binding Xre family transcriptional regulator